MTDNDKTLSPDTQWIDTWLPHRDKIVSALTLTSDVISGSPRRKLRQLADEVAFVDNEMDVLKNPLALEIFLHLEGIPNVTGDFDPLDSSHSLTSSTKPESTAPTENIESRIEAAVNAVVLSHLKVQSRGQRVLTVIAYPLIVLTVCTGVLVLTSLLVVPTFEQMFDEFGLQLPFFTQTLFAIAAVIQSPMTYLGLASVGACVGLLAWLLWGSTSPLHRRSGASGTSVNLHGSGPRTTRGAWADWAWHVSLLMRAGLGKTEAIEMAGAASQQSWLARGSRFWADAIRNGDDPFHGVTHFRKVPCHLLADALGLDVALTQHVRPPNTSSRTAAIDTTSLKQYQAGVLRDIAELYWDRDQRGTVWRLGWVSPLIVFGVGFIIWFVVIALFAPLVSLITGLS